MILHCLLNVKCIHHAIISVKTVSHKPLQKLNLICFFSRLLYRYTEQDREKTFMLLDMTTACYDTTKKAKKSKTKDPPKNIAHKIFINDTFEILNHLFF